MYMLHDLQTGPELNVSFRMSPNAYHIDSVYCPGKMIGREPKRPLRPTLRVISTARSSAPAFARLKTPSISNTLHKPSSGSSLYLAVQLPSQGTRKRSSPHNFHPPPLPAWCLDRATRPLESGTATHPRLCTPSRVTPLGFSPSRIPRAPR